MDAPDQPGCTAHLILDVILGIFRDFVPVFDGVSIKGVYTQLWHPVVVEHDNKIIFESVHKDVGSDILGHIFGKLPTGSGLQACNDIYGCNDIFNIRFNSFGNGLIVFVLKMIEMVGNNVGNDGIVEFKMPGLDQQTLAKIPGADTDGIEGLHGRQNLFNFDVRGHAHNGKFCNGHIQITVFVKVAYNQAADLFLFCCRGCHQQLPQKVFTQGFLA